MVAELGQFIDDFVAPLLGGGDVHVGRPLRPRDRDVMAQTAGTMLGHTGLRYLRLQRAQELTPHPLLPDPDIEELSLWIGLHNVLVFDHPERSRVWARPSTWRRTEGATRTLLTLPFPTEAHEGLARHVSVGAFIELGRVDTVVAGPVGEMRYVGQDIPRSRFRLAATIGGGRKETLRWLGQPHAPETHRLIEDAMRASPLTCLLNPLLAPPGWSPLWATAFLHDRALARAVCHRWAAHKDWIALGGAVTSALLPSLPAPPRRRPPSEGESGASRTVESLEGEVSRAASGPLALPGAVLPRGPAALSAVVGALVHLHFLKVLELDARLGVALGSRDPGILAFLALPLLLPWLGEVTGTPLGEPTMGHAASSGGAGRGQGLGSTAFEVQAQRRWAEYTDHLEELVPRSAVENLLATLVPAIVQTS